MVVIAGVLLLAAGLAYRNATGLADWYAAFAARYLPEGASSFAPASTPRGAYFYCARQVSRRMHDHHGVETYPGEDVARTVSLGDGPLPHRSFVDEARATASQRRYDFVCTVHFDAGRWVLEELQVQQYAAEAWDEAAGRRAAGR